MQWRFLNPSSSRTWRKRELGQQAWSAANFCFLNFESSLFFSFLSFPKFSTTRTEETLNFICGPGIATLLPCSGSVGRSVLYRPSPQPVSWLCTAMLLLRVRRCARTRGNPCTDRERTVHTNNSIRAGQLCRLTERRLPGQPCRPSQRADHSTSPEVLRTHRKQENILQVHHCCSPTTKLPLEHLTVKQWMKMQLKMKGENYAP